MSNRPTHACIRCADRKVKCDRLYPCGPCMKHVSTCIYRAPPKGSDRGKRSAKYAALEERAKVYEALLRDRGIIPQSQTVVKEGAIQSSSQQLEGDTPDLPRPSITTTRLLGDNERPLLVNNSLWTRIGEELHVASEEQNVTSPGDHEVSFGSDDDIEPPTSDSANNPALPHPPYEYVLQLWNIYKINFNPLTKIIHVAALEGSFERAARSTHQIHMDLEVLMFAVYSAAILTIDDHDCTTQFGAPRDHLLHLYISATMTALTRANYMGTNSTMVLQALIIHLFVTRDIEEPRATWVLTGVAVRLAQGMGLHKDGSQLGLSPYETQIRRRIWWQLKMHDGRAAEMCGQSKFQDFTDMPAAPVNIDDDELKSDMAIPAENTPRATDMIFCAAKIEVGVFIGKRATSFEQKRATEKSQTEWQAGDNLLEQDEFIKKAEDHFEMKFFRFCDPTDPLHLMTMLYFRCNINVGRFLSHHPQKWKTHAYVSEAERNFVWSLCLRIFEQYNMMQSSPQLKGFAWMIGYHIQWSALVHILDRLRMQPMLEDSEKAWQLVEATYTNNPLMLKRLKRPLFAVIGALCLQAFQARRNALSNGPVSQNEVPEFITTLHNEQTSLRRERRARLEKRSMFLRSSTMQTDPKKSGELLEQGSTDQKTHIQQQQSPDTLGHDNESDSHLPVASNQSEIDNHSFDFMLWNDDPTSGDTASDFSNQQIDWTLWDTWLSSESVVDV